MIPTVPKQGCQIFPLIGMKQKFDKFLDLNFTRV